ncbi:MAG: haloacid dehalogenase-like hydrolase [Calothrix sp. MO_167.B12]|nr:haloacid dehalogenase-like hydrolase [Calothrix sp. MO_167.B12]
MLKTEVNNVNNIVAKKQIHSDEVVHLIQTAQKNTPILIDFDETIFLRNSTEEYLNSLRPRILGAILLSILSFLKPWNWLPSPIKGESSRDWLRVVVATIFFPWTLILWQWQAKQLALAYGNTTLIQAINQNYQANVIIATLGFDFIVRPIAKHLPIDVNDIDIIGCRFWKGVIDRFQGKLAMVTNKLGDEIVKHSIVITDSIQDLPLLSFVSKPCLIVWSEAKTVHAMDDVYIPFFYIERVKRKPGYFLKEILGNDLFCLILASSWLSSHPISHAISLTFLMLSFWCIYEVGYMENDLVSEKFEKKPVLSENYQRYKKRINLWQPWIWSAVFAIPGIILLESSQGMINDVLNTSLNTFQLQRIAIDSICWLALLIFVRLTYWIYNHLDKKTRVWIYPILQVCRYFGFLVLTATNVIGTMILVAQVISRWIIYMIYRYAQGNWSNSYKNIIQLLLCLIFGLLITAVTIGTHDTSILYSLQVCIIFIYCICRGRRLPLEIIRTARPIWQDHWGVQ